MKFAVPMSGTSKIETRLRSILDTKQSRSAVTRQLFFGLSLLALAATIPLAIAKEAGADDTKSKTKEANQAKLPTFYVREAYAVATGGPNQPLFDPSDRAPANPVIQPQKQTIVTGFKFIGNASISSAELEKALVSRKGVILDVQRIQGDRAAIQGAYFKKGIYLKAPSVRQDDSGIVTYSLVENPIVTAIRFSGNKSVPAAELEKALVNKIGVGFDWKSVGADKEAIQKVYTDKGLAASVNYMAPNYLGLVSYEITEGKVTQIKIEGLNQIDSAQVRKITSVQIGGPIDPLVFQRDAAQVANDTSLGLPRVNIQDDPDTKGGMIVTYTFVAKGGRVNTVRVPAEFLRPVGSTQGSVPPPPIQNAQPQINSRIVTGFKFSGNAMLTSDELQDVLVSKIGTLLNSQNIEGDVQAIRKIYSDKGYASLLQGLSQDESGVVSYSLLEARITQIKLEGLNKTDPQRARNLITTQANQPYDLYSLRGDVTRLYQTSLFDDVNTNINDDPNVEGGVIITFVFKEKKAKS